MRGINRVVMLAVVIGLGLFAMGCPGDDNGGSSPSAIQITSITLPNGTVGASYSYTFTATGGTPPYNWTVASGTLPAGLSLDAVTGVLSGTPTEAATHNFTIQVTDSGSPPQSAKRNFSMQIEQPGGTLKFTTSSLPDGEVEVAYTATLTATGGTPPYNWTVTSGTLPAGLSLDAVTGVLSGTPTEAATYNFAVQVTGSATPAQVASRDFTVTIKQSSGTLKITTNSLPEGEVGCGYSVVLTATGGTPPYFWSISSGEPPDGLYIPGSSGEITGTPTKEGTFTFTVKVTDSNGDSAQKALSILIKPSSSPWEEIHTTDLTVRIGAGERCYIYFDNEGEILEVERPDENITAQAKEALDRAPDWLKFQLAENLEYLSSALQDEYAQLILDASDPYIDEMAFQVAHIAPEDLKKINTTIMKENVQQIYTAAEILDYVEIIDNGSSDESDYYSTIKYRVSEDGAVKEIELPKEIYYWFIVHPKITVELPSYVGGYFWRDYLFNKSDSGYPVLKERLASCDTLWNCIKNELDSGAVGAVSKWVMESMNFTSTAHKTQPIVIYHDHRGTCTVHARLTAAAARAALIPCVVTTAYADNHKWNEFYDRRWIHWEPEQFDPRWAEGSALDDPLNRYDKSWKLAAVFNWRGDGYTWTVTERYSKTCTLKVDTKDAAGNPVDGARVIIENRGGWPLERCTVGYTDASGKCQFLLGDESQQFRAVVKTAIGQAQETVISSSVADEIYTYSPTINGSISIPTPTEGAIPPNPLDEYKLEFDIVAEVEMTHGKNPDDGSTFCESRDAGNIDIFICDSENFADYDAGDPFEAFEIAPDSESKTGSFVIPTDDRWYLMLSNEDAVVITEVVSVSVKLFKKR